jgi:carbamate kinase
MAFPAGSMGPKIEACRRFVTATGHPATIGALADAQALLAGTAGTTITPTTPHTAHAAHEHELEVDHAGHVGGYRTMQAC